MRKYAWTLFVVGALATTGCNQAELKKALADLYAFYWGAGAAGFANIRHDYATIGASSGTGKISAISPEKSESGPAMTLTVSPISY